MKKYIVLLIIILLSFSLLGCKKTSPDKNYEDFDHIDHWDLLNELPEEETLILYYSPFCAISKSIEDEVTEYFVILEDTGVPIYLIHEGMIYEQGVQPFDVIETPTVLVYVNSVFQEMISGAKPIQEYLAAKVK